MATLSEAQVLENSELVGKLINSIKDVTLKNQLNEMFTKIGGEFFTAPASSREEYHGCFPGGLCDHSLRVTKTLVSLADTLTPGKYKKDTLIFVGLMHDLGKVGDGDQPFYVPLEGDQNAWKRKRGELYGINPDLIYMPTCDRTMFLLNKFGIQVEAEEYVAIRISDGPYEKSNEKYNMKEPDLAILLHFADRWACSLEKAT